MARHARTLPTGESLETARRRARKIVASLRRRYPNIQLPLRHENALQLLVATILSAQCTDAMVNRVTPALFARYRSAEEFARAEARQLEAQIHSTGFFRQKAKAIIGMSRALVERFGGEVPATMEALLTLEGVGRKTANVILGGFHGIPGVVVDTHVRRLSQRLGLTGSDHPDRIEQDLMRLIPRKDWSDFSLRLIFFGREICLARKPLCPTCPLNRLCPSARYGGHRPGWAGDRDGPAGPGAALQPPLPTQGGEGVGEGGQDTDAFGGSTPRHTPGWQADPIEDCRLHGRGVRQYDCTTVQTKQDCGEGAGAQRRGEGATRRPVPLRTADCRLPIAD